MNQINRILTFAALGWIVLGTASIATAAGPDPAIMSMGATTSWKYRAPYATYHVSVGLQNLGNQDYVGRRGRQWVYVWACEQATLGRPASERLIARLPFETLAAGEELELKTNYYPLVQPNHPERLTFRAAIAYDDGGSSDNGETPRDVNPHNNVWPR